MRLSAPAVREIVAQFDTDGDDQVDFSEFVAFFFHQKIRQRLPLARQQQPPSGSAVDRLGGSGGYLGKILAKSSLLSRSCGHFLTYSRVATKQVSPTNKIICAVVNFAMEVSLVTQGGDTACARIDEAC